jgi:hypothetical protein
LRKLVAFSDGILVDRIACLPSLRRVMDNVLYVNGVGNYR